MRSSSLDLAGALVRTQTGQRKKLLFLTHAGLYKHASLAPAEKAVTELGQKGGFDVTTLEGYEQDSDKIDLSVLTPEYLAQYDGLMLMTNGNLPLTAAQKKAIVDFVRNGKALVGVHCASLTMYDYPEFGEVLGGYYRRSIVPMTLLSQNKIAVLKVEDPAHPATKMLGGSWPLVEELYQFGTAVWDASRPTENISQVGRLHIPMAFSRDRVHVLLRRPILFPAACRTALQCRALASVSPAHARSADRQEIAGRRETPCKEGSKCLGSMSVPSRVAASGS